MGEIVGMNMAIANAKAVVEAMAMALVLFCGNIPGALTKSTNTRTSGISWLRLRL